MVEKIEDLTQSLSRTSDVLSTADRMIDHYRNLNTEQEYVIAKLKEDLQHSNEPKKPQNHMEGDLMQGKGNGNKLSVNRELESHSSKTLRDSKRKIIQETSSEAYSEDYDSRQISQRKRPPNSPRVRFKDANNSPDNELEFLKSSMTDFKRKQESLESGLRKQRELHDEEINRLDTTLRKQLSFERSDEKTYGINSNLKKLQQQLEDDHAEYTKQQLEVKNITQEMKSLKDVFQEATVPKNAETVTASPIDTDRKLASYKRKVSKQDNAIRLLKEQLENQREEARGCETTVYKMQSLEKLKSQQLKLLEQQLDEEKGVKMNVLKEFEDTQQKLSEANKERSELLYHLSDIKNEAQVNKLAYEQSSHKIPQMKALLEDGEKQRELLSNQVDNLNNELQSNNNGIKNLKSQLTDYKVNLKNLEAENQNLTTQIEEATSQYHDIKTELDSTKEMLLELKQNCQRLEASKHVVKKNALNTLKEYRSKYRNCQKEIQNRVGQQKEKEIELSKAVSVSNEQEIVNLTLKKELQDLTNEMGNLQNRILEGEHTCDQLSHDKCQLEDALSKANDQTKINHVLQREMHELKNENQSLTSQITEEKSKRQEVQSLLQQHYEKNISSKDERMSLKKQLEQESSRLQLEHDKRLQEAIKTKGECKMASEEKLNELSKENENLVKTLKSSGGSLQQLTEEHEDVKKRLKQQEAGFVNETEKNKVLSQKLRRITEENKKIRKQFHVMKNHLCERLRNAQTNASTSVEPNILLPKDINKVQIVETTAKTDGIGKIFTILLQDSENLLGLLSYEEENVPTLKVIPHNVLPDYRKAILEIREKYQTCYSIAKTLKGRFQQQKSLIKRAQEKIKSQIEQIRILYDTRDDGLHNLEKITTLEVLRKSDQEKITFIENLRKKDEEKISYFEASTKQSEEKISSLEASRMTDQKLIASHITTKNECQETIANLEILKAKDVELIRRRDAEICDLKYRINELTRDLQGCTRALHKSVEVDKERKSVLDEIELLKSEHKERQQIDENFFRCTEKIELLTEQLNDAKHSLSEIKQDSIDRSETTNRLIDTFGSVSPSRKRRLFLYDSPLFKSTKDFGQNDSLLGGPTRDTDTVRNIQFDNNDSLEDILPRNIHATTDNTLVPTLQGCPSNNKTVHQK